MLEVRCFYQLIPSLSVYEAAFTERVLVEPTQLDILFHAVYKSLSSVVGAQRRQPMAQKAERNVLLLCLAVLLLAAITCALLPPVEQAARVMRGRLDEKC